MIKAQKSILVVEDESDILMSLRDFLESEGYHVLTAENGREALKILQNSKIPNLILLDMKMPVMNGWEFANEFHNQHGEMSPIMVITAAADAQKRADDIHANGWLEKPFGLEALLEKVKMHESH